LHKGLTSQLTQHWVISES